MTSWIPSFEPYLEIQYDVNVNESGYKIGVATVFNKIIAVFPTIKNSSASLFGTAGATLTCNWSGGAYDIYLVTSANILQTSCDYVAKIYGIR